MSYGPPYGLRLPANYTVTYTPPGGTSIGINYYLGPNEKFVAPVAITEIAFGKVQVGNPTPYLTVQGIAPPGFGTTTVTSPAQYITPGSISTFIFGSTHVKNNVTLNVLGGAFTNFGTVFSVVNGYYSPVLGSRIPMLYNGGYVPPVGNRLPIDYENTHVFRQLAPYGLNGNAFGSTHIVNVAQGINVYWRGIPAPAPDIGTALVQNHTNYISPLGFPPSTPSTGASIRVYLNTISVWEIVAGAFGNASIYNKNQVIQGQGIPSVTTPGGGFYGLLGPTGNEHVYNYNTPVWGIGFDDTLFGATMIAFKDRTVYTLANFPFAPNLGIATVTGTYPLAQPGHVWPVGIGLSTFGTASLHQNCVYGIGWNSLTFGQTTVLGNNVGPCTIPFTYNQFGTAQLFPCTQYISPPEIEPKLWSQYNEDGTPNIAKGCGANFIGIPGFSPQYITINVALNGMQKMDYMLNPPSPYDSTLWGAPTVTNQYRYVYQSPFNNELPPDVWGNTTITNKDRYLYPVGIGPNYLGNASLNATQYIQPWWGFTDPTETVATPTDAYGNATVAYYVPPPIPNSPQGIMGIGFLDEAFGSNQAQNFNRTLQMSGWLDEVMYTNWVGPPWPIDPTGFDSSVFGSGTWASYMNRTLYMSGWDESAIGPGFTGADGEVFGPMRVYNGQQFISVLGEGIEAYEPLVGLSCGVWNKIGATVSHA